MINRRELMALPAAALLAAVANRAIVSVKRPHIGWLSKLNELAFDLGLFAESMTAHSR